jgi:3-oxoacyl-[acyl-carrier-protein] synthase-3
MNPHPITITSMGHAHPDEILDNSFFTALDIGTEGSWIEDRTGIKERRGVLTQKNILDLRHGRKTIGEIKNENPEQISLASLGKKAWQKLLSRSHTTPIVELVLSGTSVPDFDVPAQASILALELGIPIRAAFDINSACSSFVVALLTAKSLLENNTFTSAALFHVERYTLRTDYTSRKNSILFGDGAAVAHLSRDPKAQGLRILDIFLETDPTGAYKALMADGEYFDQNGAAVQKFAVTTTCLASNHLLKKNNLSIEDLAYFCSHQANLRMLMSVCEKMGIPEKKHIFNVDSKGNQGGAGAPCVLSENWERFAPGDKILLTVVGAGLTWGGVLLEKTTPAL